jgi:CDP-glucose 4,6-dehydratase
MEDLVIDGRARFWRDRPVLVTGHSGFIGSWLCLALSSLGARVSGLSLPPATRPSHFAAAGIEGLCRSAWIDIRDAKKVAKTVVEARPQVVFHLAAQALVRTAAREPLVTHATNIMGTANLLDALSSIGSVRAAVVFTTDKVYENLEGPWPYRETDPLGGYEPYGASKAAAELVAASYRGRLGGGALATLRAGNVIGGGDGAADRLVPDAIRAFSAGQRLEVRNPASIRPWQHVLEVVSASLILAQALAEAPAWAEGGWNIGPNLDDMRPVSWLADRLAGLWGEGAVWAAEPGAAQVYEAVTLRLDSSKARARLGWAPRWSLDEALARTVHWYRAFHQGADTARLSLAQWRDFTA